MTHTENKIYRFVLCSCYSNKKHFLQLAYDSDSKTKTVYIYPPSTELEIDVDSKEIAEDLDSRYTWLKDWSTSSNTDQIPASEYSDEHVSNIIDSGIMEYGYHNEDNPDSSVIELFLYGTTITGTIILNRIETLSNNKLSHEWFASFSGELTDKRPYILTHNPIAKGNEYKNLSYLPKRIKKRIPSEYKYWMEDDETKSVELRNNLIKGIDAGDLYFPMMHKPNGRYSIIREWTPREYEKYHLVIDGKQHIHLATGTDMTQCKTPKVEFSLRNSEMELPIEKAKLGSITLSNDSPHFANAIDWGQCIIHMDRDDSKIVKFMGAKMKDVIRFKKDESGWKANVVEVGRTSSHDLNNKQIDKIIELTKAKRDRPEIAEAVGCSKKAVFIYQKTLGYV
jgi:hypothetical protein